MIKKLNPKNPLEIENKVSYL